MVRITCHGPAIPHIPFRGDRTRSFVDLTSGRPQERTSRAWGKSMVMKWLLSTPLAFSGKQPDTNSFSMDKAVNINNQYFQYFMTSSYLHEKRLRLIDVRFIQRCILCVFLSSWPRVKHAASWPLTAWIWRSPHDPSNPAMKSSVAQWPMQHKTNHKNK